MLGTGRWPFGERLSDLPVVAKGILARDLCLDPVKLTAGQPRTFWLYSSSVT